MALGDLGRRRRRRRGRGLREFDDFGDFGRRRRRRHLRGLGDPGFAQDLTKVLIGAGVGAVGLTGLGLINRVLPISEGYKLAIAGTAGILGGAALTRVNEPAGVGLGAAAGASAVIGGIALLMLRAAGAGAPVSAYTYSRRYGMRGIGQRDPYATRFGAALQPDPGYGWGVGRTRVVEQFPGARELGAYTYSRRYGMHGFGARPMPTRAFTNPMRVFG